MPVYKLKYKSGTERWWFKFQPPGATRDSRPIREFGFTTKREAADAERDRSILEAQKYRIAKNGPVATPVPTTLARMVKIF